MTVSKRTMNDYIKELESLTYNKYGRHHIERLFGEELNEDIQPIIKRNLTYGRIRDIEEKYKYLSWYHSWKHSEYRKMHVELRRIREETPSFMVDKMGYFDYAYHNIKRIRELYEAQCVSEYDNVFTV